MGIKMVKYGMKYGPWRFRHYVIGIILQRLNTTDNFKENFYFILVQNVKKYENQTKHNIRYEIRFSGILDGFN